MSVELIKICRNNEWFFDGCQIEVLNSLSYLGITLLFNGKFTKTQNIISMQGRKCMYGIAKTFMNENLNVETKLSVFDTYISSILNYGCEIWGFDKAKDVEKVHTDFCKRILNVKGTTSNYMIYSELGRVPLHIIRKIRIMK